MEDSYGLVFVCTWIVVTLRKAIFLKYGCSFDFSFNPSRQGDFLFVYWRKSSE